MPDPQSYCPRPSDIPTSAGVYRFSDEQGRVIYVGKAKNLRNRLSTYFQNPKRLHPRTYRMVHTASSVQWTVVANELEALTLEYSWIKEFSPHFNVMYNRNDMSFPYLAITLNEEYPRAQVMRGSRKKGVRYFGPFPQAWTIRDTLDHLTKIFPVRTCSNGAFARAKRAGRPCLLGHIGKCAAPCAGWITPEKHRELAEEMCKFMGGKTGPVLRDLHEQMNRASEELEFERAASYRDQIEAIKTVLEKNTVVMDDGTDADVLGVSFDDLESSVYVLNVRGGRIRGVRSWVSELTGETSSGQICADVLEQIYGDLPELPKNIRASRPRKKKTSVDDLEHLSSAAVPDQILVEELSADNSTLEQWLHLRRGGKVTISVPIRGDKKSLLEMATKNAQESLRVHKMKRVGDITRRSQALEQLQELLDLQNAPLRIECYDVSHIQGTNQVASMVVFEDGMPAKKEYRQFVVRPRVDGISPDDTAAMSQVLERRLARLRAEESGVQGEDEDGNSYNTGPIDQATGKLRRFSYRPDLIVVDGGLPQVNAAAKTMRESGFDLPVVGLAKRLEEIWLPGEEFPLILPRTSPALFLLQHLRDESHRRAISHHRNKRQKAMVNSVLDNIEGVGPARSSALLKHFKTFKNVRSATVEELSQVKGISQSLAEKIYRHLGEGKP
ncbi:excinuclease ABC subunit UvrC [Actinomycetaceae bacterium TAE3-ERU4]|nr:excinuclease ABC subunit UvrC [Actinomycetaceae bacterium TAE3-ERU4]